MGRFVGKLLEMRNIFQSSSLKSFCQTSIQSDFENRKSPKVGVVATGFFIHQNHADDRELFTQRAILHYHTNTLITKIADGTPCVLKVLQDLVWNVRQCQILVYDAKLVMALDDLADGLHKGFLRCVAGSAAVGAINALNDLSREICCFATGDSIFPNCHHSILIRKSPEDVFSGHGMTGAGSEFLGQGFVPTGIGLPQFISAHLLVRGNFRLKCRLLALGRACDAHLQPLHQLAIAAGLCQGFRYTLTVGA